MPHSKYHRKDENSYTIGVYPTIELLRSRPDLVLHVLVSSKGSSNEGITQIRDICTKEQIDIIEADRQIRKLSNEKTYAIGVFKKFDSIVSKGANHIILIEPDSHGNLGTIIRTMVGLGFHDLVLIGNGADIYAPETIRASMGSLFKINFHLFPTILDYKKAFQNHTLYSFMTGGKTSLRKTTFSKPFGLIFGNEGEGLPQEYSEYTHSVRIEQSDGIDSLNLAVSAGIAMYISQEKSLPTSDKSDL